MIEIREATQADLDYCREHPVNPAVAEHYMGLKLLGWAVTGLHKGKILGVGGAVVYWPGVAEGWYCLSDEVNTHKIAAVHCLNAMVKRAFKDLSLHRFQATIRSDFTQARKLVEAAGFVNETPDLMKKYTEEGKDSYLYALVI